MRTLALGLLGKWGAPSTATLHARTDAHPLPPRLLHLRLCRSFPGDP